MKIQLEDGEVPYGWGSSLNPLWLYMGFKGIAGS